MNVNSSFSKNFGGKCEAVHLEKHRYLFFEPEKDYYLVLVCVLGTFINNHC